MQTLCSNSRYWPSCSSCHLYHIPTTRGSLFSSTTRYFPVPTVPATAFSLKGTLRLMSWTAPLPQVSQLERQSEQQGQKALQEEHSREAKQIKDIFSAFKASPIKFCRFLTVTARKIHMAEKLSSSLAWQQALPPSCTCLSVSTLQSDVAVQWITFRILLY